MTAPMLSTNKGNRRPVVVGDKVLSRRTRTGWAVRGIYIDDLGSLRLNLWDRYRGWRWGMLAANYVIVERLPLTAEVSHEAA